MQGLRGNVRAYIRMCLYMDMLYCTYIICYIVHTYAILYIHVLYCTYVCYTVHTYTILCTYVCYVYCTFMYKSLIRILIFGRIKSLAGE